MRFGQSVRAFGRRDFLSGKRGERSLRKSPISIARRRLCDAHQIRKTIGATPKNTFAPPARITRTKAPTESLGSNPAIRGRRSSRPLLRRSRFGWRGNDFPLRTGKHIVQPRKRRSISALECDMSISSRKPGRSNRTKVPATRQAALPGMTTPSIAARHQPDQDSSQTQSELEGKTPRPHRASSNPASSRFQSKFEHLSRTDQPKNVRRFLISVTTITTPKFTHPQPH
jgi:hypothetical protein